MNTIEDKWNFEKLVVSIRQAHEELAAQAGRAANLSVTLRNWLVGCYIAEYEQNGADRAEYGIRLLENLSSRLNEGGMVGVAARSLRQYRQFYLIYPGIWQTASAKSETTTPIPSQSTIASPKLIQRISFSHFAELIGISEYQLELPKKDEKRRFIEEQIRETVDQST